MPDKDIILKIENISKNFGGIQAVKNFSLSLAKGEIAGIIGPNGAGKTTIFNLISGIYKVDEGKIFLRDEEITNKEQHEIARLGIARTFQNIRVFEALTVQENVSTAIDPLSNYGIIGGILPSRGRKGEEQLKDEAINKWLGFVGLESYKNHKPKNLAYGLQRKLEIARALALNPKVLLLDEPAAGLNPNEVARLINLIQKLNEEFSFSILIIEHRMEVIMKLCERICVQNFGKTLAAGCPEEIQNDERVIKAYLGEGCKNA